MQIIDRIVKAEAKDNLPVVDRVSLTWEERQKSRQKLRTAHGQEVALAFRPAHVSTLAIYYPRQKAGSKSTWLTRMCYVLGRRTGGRQRSWPIKSAIVIFPWILLRMG